MELKHDLSQHYPLKAAFEQVFGKSAFAELKECSDFKIWKKHCLKLLSAIGVAVHETVKIVDEEWFEEIDVHLEHGKEITKTAKSADELFASLSATLMRIVFLQIGFVPRRHSMDKVPLSKEYWKLDSVRSVQYVQSKEQRDKAHNSTIQRLAHRSR